MSESSSNKRQRRHFSGQQKTEVVKSHLVDGQSVADLRDQYGIQPTQFYQWQRQLFENGGIAFK